MESFKKHQEQLREIVSRLNYGMVAALAFGAGVLAEKLTPPQDGKLSTRPLTEEYAVYDRIEPPTKEHTLTLEGERKMEELNRHLVWAITNLSDSLNPSDTLSALCEVRISDPLLDENVPKGIVIKKMLSKEFCEWVTTNYPERIADIVSEGLEGSTFTALADAFNNLGDLPEHVSCYGEAIPLTATELALVEKYKKDKALILSSYKN